MSAVTTTNAASGTINHKSNRARRLSVTLTSLFSSVNAGGRKRALAMALPCRLFVSMTRFYEALPFSPLSLHCDSYAGFPLISIDI
ncbi:hypothetical protein [Paraburkholderia sabiae]|uniref:hypothetical protein n=1 Tax=Paraburkholderia sabiae TaxID=273251 RepID=UPI001CC35446|nr:hypothetical protein [Paraburkholderia sabiae]